MSSNNPATFGHALARVLGIKLKYRNPEGGDPVTRGESAYSVNTADTFVEEEPTTAEWIRDVVPTPQGLLRYAYNLFPFVHWIGRYNALWLAGDLVAGQSYRLRVKHH